MVKYKFHAVTWKNLFASDFEGHMRGPPPSPRQVSWPWIPPAQMKDLCKVNFGWSGFPSLVFVMKLSLHDLWSIKGSWTCFKTSENTPSILDYIFSLYCYSRERSSINSTITNCSCGLTVNFNVCYYTLNEIYFMLGFWFKLTDTSFASPSSGKAPFLFV